MNQKNDHICVCICTLERVDLLCRLLKELAVQKTEGLFSFSVVVVDNDSNESARPLVENLSKTVPYETTYSVEPEKNIALARNRAVEAATGNFIAFIDDDEFPIADWLLVLYRECTSRQVDAVLGPVKPYFDEEPPAWVRKGDFYNRPSYPTGTVIDWRKGRTGNILFRREILGDVEIPFRPEFTTGEDQDFARRVMEKGRVFVWCDEAVAYEVVPPERWNLKFMIRRALLRGKISLRHPTTGIASCLKSLAAVFLYTLSLPITLALGKHIFVKHLVSLFDHLGKCLAFLRINPISEHYH